jgi:fatty-acyl-CoA synthase
MPTETALTDTVSTIPALLDRAGALSRGEAIVMPTERITFPELLDRTADLGRRMLGAGLGPGDRIGLLLGDTIGGIAALLAAMRIGLVAVPVSNRYKERELAHVARHSGMRLLVAEEASIPLLEAAGVPATCPIVVGLDDPGFTAGAATIEEGTVERLAAAVEPGQDAIFLYTSGTTADPKGCVYVHAGMAAQAFAYADRLALTPDDRFFTPLPFFHVSAIVSLAAAIAAPCAIVHVGRRFDPSVALDLLERERCTISFTAFETIWMPVLNEPRFATADLSALRQIVNVGTPGSLQRMQERFPRVPQVSAFGGTETGGFAALGAPDEPLESRISTGGRPLDGCELRAIDPETGEDVPPGEVGELLMRGPTRFARYHDDPEQTALAIDDDGWFHSGDLGRIDPDGRVAFVGRLKDMLKVGGENVAAAEVETHLLTHPAVEIAQVVSAPDARYAEVPAAFVQLAPGQTATELELIDHCIGKIATFKVPRYVRFVTEWPMSGTKIRKVELRERIAAELEAAGITEAPKISSR